jgi:hypothetical protein
LKRYWIFVVSRLHIVQTAAWKLAFELMRSLFLVFVASFGSTDYRCESRTGCLSCFASANSSWFVTTNNDMEESCNSEIHLLNYKILNFKALFYSNRKYSTRQADESWCLRRFYLSFSITGFSGKNFRYEFDFHTFFQSGKGFYPLKLLSKRSQLWRFWHTFVSLVCGCNTWKNKQMNEGIILNFLYCHIFNIPTVPLTYLFFLERNANFSSFFKACSCEESDLFGLAFDLESTLLNADTTN